jgi:hypothetical protein
MKMVMLAVLWIIWCALHSGMISQTATGYLKRRLGTRFRIYRLVFISLGRISDLVSNDPVDIGNPAVPGRGKTL